MKNDEWTPTSILPHKDGYYWVKLKNGYIVKRFFAYDGLFRFYGIKTCDIEAWKPV